MLVQSRNFVYIPSLTISHYIPESSKTIQIPFEEVFGTAKGLPKQGVWVSKRLLTRYLEDYGQWSMNRKLDFRILIPTTT